MLSENDNNDLRAIIEAWLVWKGYLFPGSKVSLTVKVIQPEVIFTAHTPIEDWGLSVRARNGLLNSNICKIGDLLTIDPRSIKFRGGNFGKKSFEEVAKKLIALGVDIHPNWRLPFRKG